MSKFEQAVIALIVLALIAVVLSKKGNAAGFINSLSAFLDWLIGLVQGK